MDAVLDNCPRGARVNISTLYNLGKQIGLGGTIKLSEHIASSP